ncbi:DUF1906 domain-containing protein [Paenibacillus alkalitolerans]|uniref:DUF1906 domain-containing protein n=1 Tax=Paenibacillus alkalitolerans TaxID=2799335 RepID=UPI0018F64A75|nr:DUF1906 domain-containing protein [Paenibacillus alkalitolerans]
MAEGIDRALPFTSEEVLNCLRSHGISFIGRYYKPRKANGDISDYVLTPEEARLISSKRLYIVAVYQDSGTRSSDYNYPKGANDYSHAMQRAQEIGQPTNTPIYFAVDYDAAGTETLENVFFYFRGILDRRTWNESLGNPVWPVGVYGSADVIDAVVKIFPEIKYKWQTVSWSRGRVTDFNLYQYAIDVGLAVCPGAGKVDRVRSNGNGGGFLIQ